MGCHFLLQGIFPTQGWNPGILFIRQSLNSATWEAQRSWYKQLQKKRNDYLYLGHQDRLHRRRWYLNWVLKDASVGGGMARGK